MCVQTDLRLKNRDLATNFAVACCEHHLPLHFFLLVIFISFSSFVFVSMLQTQVYTCIQNMHFTEALEKQESLLRE